MGKILVQNQTTPTETPSSGTTEIFVDSVTKKLKTKDDTGTTVDYTPGGEANTASNVGSGSGVFKQKSGVDLQFKSLIGTSPVTVTANANDLTISSTAEANTASNVGAGSHVFKQKSGVDLQFRSIVAGSGISVTQNANDLTLSSSAVADPFSSVDISDHFITAGSLTERIGSLGWSSSSTGTGNISTPINGEDRRPGIYRMNAGTTAAGRSSIFLGTSGGLGSLKPNTSGQTITWKSRIRLTGVLATFEMAVFGLGDVTSAVGDQTNGIYFQILSTDLNWFLVSTSGGVQTRLNTGIVFSSGTWNEFEFTYNVNTATITGKINGVSFPGSITTNLPTVVISPLYKTDAIAAGTAVNLDVDVFQLTITGTTL